MDIEKLSKMSYEEQEKYLKSKMIPVITTETPLRKWQRRLEVALTPKAKQKAKAKIKELSKEYKNAKNI